MADRVLQGAAKTESMVCSGLVMLLGLLVWLPVRMDHINAQVSEEIATILKACGCPFHGDYPGRWPFLSGELFTRK